MKVPVVLGILCTLYGAYCRPHVDVPTECQHTHLGLTLTSGSGQSPVRVLTSKTTYGTNSKITVTLQAKPGETFYGFRVFAQPSNYTPQDGRQRCGTFIDVPDSARLECKNSQEKMSVLHESDINIPKSSVTFTWKAPSSFDTRTLQGGDVKFWVAVQHYNSSLWVPFESEVIRYKQSICEDENRCFRQPKGCADEDCTVMVGWKAEGDHVNFHASGAMSGDERYLAVGFSLTGLMSPSPTVDCIRSKTGSAVEIKSAANEERNNRFLSPPSLGLGPKMSGEYVDGKISCHYSYIKTKTLLESNLSEKPEQQDDDDLLADLTRNRYYMIVSKGSISDEGNLMYHGNNKFIYPKSVNFTESSALISSSDNSPAVKQSVCEDEKKCFRYPKGCADSDCTVMVGWKVDGDYVNFDASGKASEKERYLAVGFSSTGLMSPSPTVDCVRSGTTIEVKAGANEERNNRFLSPPTLGLGPKTSGEYVDGRIVCHYSYIRTKTLLKPSESDKPAKQDDSDLLADLTKNKYFMIVAKGELSPEGLLTYHGNNKYINPTMINFTESSSLSEAVLAPSKEKKSVCEDEKNCFRSPANCADDSCSLMVGWKVAGDYVRFGATGAVTDSEKYLAVGFSLTGVMSPSPTVDCIRTDSGVEIKSATNTEDRNNRFLSPPTLGLGSERSGEYKDGRLTCHFTYIKTNSLQTEAGSPKLQGDEDLLADLTRNKYFMLVARGPVTSEGLLTYHGNNKVINPVAVNFTETATGKINKTIVLGDPSS